jgi:hypothetical protein
MRKDKSKYSETLPAIKNLKSINNNQNFLSLSPVAKSSISVSPVSSEKKKVKFAEEIKVVETEDLSESVTDSQVIQSGYKEHLSNLLNLVKQKHDQILSLEQKLNAKRGDLSELAHKNSYKNILKTVEADLALDSFDTSYFESIKTDFRPTSKNQDNELYKLKTKLQDTKGYINDLITQNLKYQEKNSEYEEIVSKALKLSGELQEIKDSGEAEIQKLQIKINEKTLKINSKDLELQNLSETLKKIEEKKSQASDYSRYIENNTSQLKDKILIFHSNQIKLEANLEEATKDIEKKEKIIKNLKTQLEQLENTLQLEKIKNKPLISKIEVLRESLKSKNHEIYSIPKLPEENLETHQGFPVDKTKSQQEISKKRLAMAESSLYDLAKEESKRWEQRFKNMESMLSQAKSELESFQTAELNIKKELIKKDQNISYIKSLLGVKLHPEDKNQLIDTKNTSNPILELSNLVQEIKHTYTTLEDIFKCMACFKIPLECCIAIPCGHLSCFGCKKDFEIICPQCSGNINGMVYCNSLERMIVYLKKQKKNVEKIEKAFINSS